MKSQDINYSRHEDNPMLVKQADQRCQRCRELDLCCVDCCRKGYCACPNSVGDCCHLDKVVYDKDLQEPRQQ